MFLSNGMVRCLNDKSLFTITVILLSVLLPPAKDSQSGVASKKIARPFQIVTLDPTGDKDISMTSLPSQ